jgi:hypothetical protein
MQARAPGLSPITLKLDYFETSGRDPRCRSGVSIAPQEKEHSLRESEMETALCRCDQRGLVDKVEQSC